MTKRALWTSIVVAVSAAMSVVSGCKAKPRPSISAEPPRSPEQQVERVVKGYLNAASCSDRLEHVLNPSKNGPVILEYYASIGCKVHFRSMDTSDCAKPTDRFCSVKVLMGVPAGPPGQVNEEEHSYCVSLDPSPKVDWRCSKGYNPVSLGAFKAAHDDARAGTFRLLAELSDSYLAEFADAGRTALAVRLRDVDGTTIHGFVDRNTGVARTLGDLLKDKKPHPVIVELAYGRRSEDPGTATILTLFALNWREYPSETR
jgi:hypothetical protein